MIEYFPLIISCILFAAHSFIKKRVVFFRKDIKIFRALIIPLSVIVIIEPVINILILLVTQNDYNYYGHPYYVYSIIIFFIMYFEALGYFLDKGMGQWFLKK